MYFVKFWCGNPYRFNGKCWGTWRIRAHPRPSAPVNTNIMHMIGTSPSVKLSNYIEALETRVIPVLQHSYSHAEHQRSTLIPYLSLASTALCQHRNDPQSTSVSHQNSSRNLLPVVIPWIMSPQEIVNHLHSTMQGWSSSWHRTSEAGAWMFLGFKPLVLSASRSSTLSK